MEIYKVRFNYDVKFTVENNTNTKAVNIINEEDRTETMLKYKKIFAPDEATSILIKINDSEYLFVGSTLKKFKTLDPINSFYSPIENNDCFYSYAIDSKNRYYLLIEDVILTKYNGNDPYTYYYTERNMGSLIAGSVSRRKIRIKNGVRYTTYEQNENKSPFKNIYCLYIFNLDEEQDLCGDFQLSYEPEPRNLGSMYIKYNDKRNLKVPMTFKKIKKLHEQFGKLMGFIPLIMN